MTGTTRRAFLRGAALAGGAGAAGLSLSSCATPITTAGAGSSLRYWNFFGGGDGERMIALVDAFRGENPQVDVTATTLAWGAPYYTKLAMAAAGGRPPDVATMHLSRLPVFAEHLLDPWDLDVLAEFGVREEDFPAPLRERSQLDGRLYAVPIDAHPMVLFVNTDVCGEAGLLDASGALKPLTTPEAFVEAGRACAAVTGGTGTAYPAADGFVTWMLFWTVFNQMGGTVDLTGTRAEVDRDALLRTFTWLRDYTDGTAVPRTLDAASSIAVFGSGKAGLCITGDWEVTTYLNSGIPFTMVPFPALFGTDVVRADGHSLVLPQQRSVDERSRRNAYAFVASLLKNSLGWAEGGHIPAYGPVAESPEYLALQPQSNIREVADKVAFDPLAYFSGSGSTLMTQAGQILFSVHSGTATPEQAVDQLVAWLDKQLATPSPV